jgi:hypothetical protein
MMYHRQQDSCGKRVAKYVIPTALTLGAAAGTAYGYVTKWGRGAPSQISQPVPNEEAIAAYVAFLNQTVIRARTGATYLMGVFLSEVLDFERRNNIRPYSQILNPYRNGTIAGEILMAQNFTLSETADTPLIQNSTLAGAAGSIAVGAGVGIGAVAGVIALCALGYGSYKLYRYCRLRRGERLPQLQMMRGDYGANDYSVLEDNSDGDFEVDSDHSMVILSRSATPPSRSRSSSPAPRGAPGRLVIPQRPPAHSSSSDSESDSPPPLSGSDSD